MKSFKEAFSIFKTNIRHYENLCKTENQQVLTDKQAFFKNLFSFHMRHYGGVTGHQRAEKFISDIKKMVKEGKISCTEQLIEFAIHYPDKGNILSEYIWTSIRESAGFTEDHIRHLMIKYKDQHVTRYVTYDRYTGDDEIHESYPSASECRKESIKLIHDAISNNAYGKSLLKKLNLNCSEVELEEIKHPISDCRI